jgi:hypothetical protein
MTVRESLVILCEFAVQLCRIRADGYQDPGRVQLQLFRRFGLIACGLQPFASRHVSNSARMLHYLLELPLETGLTLVISIISSAIGT